MHGLGPAPQHLWVNADRISVWEAFLYVWVDVISNLSDRVSARLSPGPCPDPKDGVGDGHAVLSTDGVEQRHGDAEEAHAEHTAASTTPQPPQQANSVYGCPGDLERTQTLPLQSRKVSASQTD